MLIKRVVDEDMYVEPNEIFGDQGHTVLVIHEGNDTPASLEIF